MNILKELEKIGITPGEKITVEEKNYIAKTVANQLSESMHELGDNYNEIYMRLFNCDIYRAQVDSKFNGVFYYYKNNAIYVDYAKNIKEMDDYIIHELIHYLQNFNHASKEDKRAGLCQFLEFKIFGLGLNEAIVQYLTAKAQFKKAHRVSNDRVTIVTNSEEYYKYITSLAIQILFMIGESKAIDSCINSNENFENELYNTFEENTEKILKNFDLILDENNKTIDKSEERIIDIYMETQELIYKTYFQNMFKRVETIKELDEQVQKLEDYETIIGKELNTSIEEDDFLAFKKEMSSKFLNKYIKINRERTGNSLAVIYRNAIYNIWRKIQNFIQTKIIRTK